MTIQHKRAWRPGWFSEATTRVGYHRPTFVSSQHSAISSRQKPRTAPQWLIADG